MLFSLRENSLLWIIALWVIYTYTYNINICKYRVRIYLFKDISKKQSTLKHFSKTWKINWWINEDINYLRQKCFILLCLFTNMAPCLYMIIIYDIQIYMCQYRLRIYLFKVAKNTLFNIKAFFKGIKIQFHCQSSLHFLSILYFNVFFPFVWQTHVLNI